MNGLYGEWYEDFKKTVGELGDDELFGSLDSLLKSSRNTFAFNRKLMAKAIDVSWVEAIENGLIHVDNVLRNPGRTIEDVEEIVPIERSRKITVESVKHLAQHTDLIQSIDKRTGKITPSKVLNVHKEESFFTYENKFVNTLIDRLYIFINTRYQKLAEVSHDEKVYTLGYDTTIDDGRGGKMRVEVKLETSDSLESTNESGFTIWQRVEKLKKIIEGYKGSDLCMKLGNTFIRPPVMRTNAIMKNVELRACLTLWQYIESYDKVGYEINVENSAVKPEENYIEDFYKLVVMNLLLFRSYTLDDDREPTELKTVKQKPMAPRFVKHFDKDIAADFNIQTEAAVGYVSADGDFKLTKKLPTNITQVFAQISEAIKIERAYVAEKQAERAAQMAAEEEAERLRIEEEKKLEEQRRIEQARQEERERIQREKEAEEQRLQELLEQKRAEQEAEERERERLEQERLARLAEIARREEEARQKREEEERILAERERLSQNNSMLRSELGEAEGFAADKLEEKNNDAELEKQAYEELTEDEIEEVKAQLEEEQQFKEQPEEIEDPRAVAARMKVEQQKREKERKLKDRADRLKAERERFMAKPFEQIRWEYSKNPIRLLQRLFTYILAYWFHIIPQDTDDPDYIKLRADIAEKKAQKEREAAERDAMEVYYRKYAMTFHYRFRRYLEDRKFKKKRALANKNKPKPTYTPPKRTPEEQREIDLEMKRLYREYHVSVFEKLKRARAERKRMKNELAESIGKKKTESAARKRLGKGFDIALTAIIMLILGFCIYVLVNASGGKAVSVFGKSVLYVETGSMEPSLHVGDYILVEKTDIKELKKDDIISFYSDDPDIKGRIVTHRIVEVLDNGHFVTKGDANTINDTDNADPDKIIGKYVGKSRFFIWMSSFGSFRKIGLLAVMIAVALGALFEIRSIAKLGQKIHEANAKENAEEHERLMRIEIEKEKQRLAQQDAAEEVKTDESR